MSQLTHSLDSSLLVRDVMDDYRPANADEVLQAAQRVLAGQIRNCEVLNSPQVVRDFLRVKLGALEHEVFAVCWRRRPFDPGGVRRILDWPQHAQSQTSAHHPHCYRGALSLVLGHDVFASNGGWSLVSPVPDSRSV
jgi:hypothetical protein